MTGEYRSRTKDEIREDRVKITELYKNGMNLTQIGEALNLPLYTVSRDLAAVRVKLDEQAIDNLDEAKKRELDRIDVIEAEAWEAWERSKQPKMMKSVTRQGSGSENDPVVKTQGKSEERNGDPRYMDIIMRCSEQRAKLLGLIVNKVAPVNPDGKSPYGLIDNMADLLKQVRQQREARRGSST